MGRLINKSEAAELMGVTRQTISNWVEDGYIPSMSKGKYTYVDEDALHALKRPLCRLENAKKRVNEAVECQKKMLKELQDSIRNIRMELNIIPLVRGSVTRKDFYLSFIDMLGEEPSVTKTMRQIMEDLIEGYSFDEIASGLGIGAERVRQLAYKCIRECANIINYENLKNINRTLVSELELLQLKTNNAESALINLLMQPITNYQLSNRAENALLHNRIRTIGQLVRRSISEVKGLRMVGHKSFVEYVNLVDRLGLHFSFDVENINDYEVSNNV